MRVRKLNIILFFKYIFFSKLQIYLTSKYLIVLLQIMPIHLLKHLTITLDSDFQIIFITGEDADCLANQNGPSSAKVEIIKEVLNSINSEQSLNFGEWV